MALNDQATLAVATGHFYSAPVGTDIPVSLTAPDATWEEIGHTSLSDIIQFSSEGGEATILGTLQNKQLRTSYSSRTESFNIVLQQFDEAGLKLFYGSNAVMDDATGMLQVPTNPIPTTCAFLIVFEDGRNVFSMYVPKCEIYRGDDFSIASAEELASLPLAVKPMQFGSNGYTYAISPLGDI